HPWILRIADVISRQPQEATAVPARDNSVTPCGAMLYGNPTGWWPSFRGDPGRQVLPPGTALLAGGQKQRGAASDRDAAVSSEYRTVSDGGSPAHSASRRRW